MFDNHSIYIHYIIFKNHISLFYKQESVVYAFTNKKNIGISLDVW